MNKPMGFDEVQAVGEWTPIEAGGHYMVIKSVTETQSSTGKDMVVVKFDFAKNDSQPDYFAQDFNSRPEADRKWSHLGTAWIIVNDYNDPRKTSKKFKTFITSIERSNKGFVTAWGGANWGSQFVGKNIGGVFGNVESEYNGQTRMRCELRWFCSTDSVKTSKVPEDKLLKPSASAPVRDGNFIIADDTDVPF